VIVQGWKNCDNGKAGWGKIPRVIRGRGGRADRLTTKATAGAAAGLLEAKRGSERKQSPNMDREDRVVFDKQSFEN